MSTPPDIPDERIQTFTRSGRAVRPPRRYEPDPDQILEDDFSDTLSDEEWGFREEHPQTEDDATEDLTDSEEDEFTSHDSHDGSYESASNTSSSESEHDDGEDETDPEYDFDDIDNVDDILEWDTLTADASDHYSSEDDTDL